MRIRSKKNVNEEYTIRRMRNTDTNDVVKIHLCAFEDYFLSKMGSIFLSYYYSTILEYEGSIALVVEDASSGSLVGFAVGFSDPPGFYRLFSSRRWRLLLIIALAIVRSPNLSGAILRNRTRVKKHIKADIDTVELSSIATNKPGYGIGGILLEQFIREAKNVGKKQIFLTTDADGNNSVRDFYENRGFTPDGFEQRAERLLCRYVLLIEDD